MFAGRLRARDVVDLGQNDLGLGASGRSPDTRWRCGGGVCARHGLAGRAGYPRVISKQQRNLKQRSRSCETVQRKRGLQQFAMEQRGMLALGPSH